jgi:hypothetical protein
MKQIKNKKDALINLSLLFYMKNNTNDKNLKELADNLTGDIIKDHKITDNDFLKVVRNLNKFIESFDNE